MEAFKVKAIEGKGLGVVAANRAIKAGELILRESPLLSVPMNGKGDILGKTNKETGEFESQDLDDELRKLSDGQLRTFFSLSDAFSAKPKTNFGIVKTNCFSVTKECETRLVLFPGIARVNHSCLPNCHHYWSNKQVRARVCTR